MAARTKEIICIVCPVGCRMTVTQQGGQVSVTRNACPRGEKYGRDEMIRPMRMVTSSVFVDGGEMPLLSVKTKENIPKSKIPKVLETLKTVRAKAPVAIGGVIVRDAAGTGTDIVATRRIRSI